MCRSRKGEKLYARVNKECMIYQTKYVKPIKGWTVLDEDVKKGDNLIELLEKHAVQKNVVKQGGFYGRTLTTYHLPILGIREEKTTEFQIRSSVNTPYYKSHKRKDCGVCRLDERDNINRTSRRNEMSQLKKKIAASEDPTHFDNYDEI